MHGMYIYAPPLGSYEELRVRRLVHDILLGGRQAIDTRRVKGGGALT